MFDFSPADMHYLRTHMLNKNQVVIFGLMEERLWSVLSARQVNLSFSDERVSLRALKFAFQFRVSGDSFEYLPSLASLYL